VGSTLEASVAQNVSVTGNDLAAVSASATGDIVGLTRRGKKSDRLAYESQQILKQRGRLVPH